MRLFCDKVFERRCRMTTVRETEEAALELKGERKLDQNGNGSGCRC
jgi:hypothetical protein